MEYKTILGKDINTGYIGTYIKCECEMLHELTNDLYNSVNVAYYCDKIGFIHISYSKMYKIYCRIDRPKTLSVKMHEKLWNAVRKTLIDN